MPGFWLRRPASFSMILSSSKSFSIYKYYMEEKGLYKDNIQNEPALKAKLLKY
mgnify:CR=1 FL=1